jgi:ArsR family transcriptional regulator, arsenate/arsenite/antimonite-responsive transcriptional repressor
MAINKKEEFSAELLAMADFAKAIAHPARLAILQTLAEKNTCICGEIVEVLPLAQATVSQHLKELKNSGLITGEVEGKKSCYCIDYDTLTQFKQTFDEFYNNIQKLSKKCC